MGLWEKLSDPDHVKKVSAVVNDRKGYWTPKEQVHDKIDKLAEIHNTSTERTANYHKAEDEILHRAKNEGNVNESGGHPVFNTIIYTVYDAATGGAGNIAENINECVTAGDKNVEAVQKAARMVDRMMRYEVNDPGNLTNGQKKSWMYDDDSYDGY